MVAGEANGGERRQARAWHKRHDARVEFAYDSTSGLLLQEVVEPSNPNPALCAETDYTYDSYGNRVTATVGNHGSGHVCADDAHNVTPCTTTSTYDTVHHHFVVQVTNCNSESETWSYSSFGGAEFGLPTSHTGGRTASQRRCPYDTFGRADTLGGARRQPGLDAVRLLFLDWKLAKRLVVRLTAGLLLIVDPAQ